MNEKRCPRSYYTPRKYVFVFVCDFIHNKSSSIFIYVEMDLQYKQMQNLYATNEFVVLFYGWIALATGEYICKTNETHYEWCECKINEATKKCVCLCLCVLVCDVHTWKCESLSVLSSLEFSLQERLHLLISLCFTAIPYAYFSFRLTWNTNFII